MRERGGPSPKGLVGEGLDCNPDFPDAPRMRFARIDQSQVARWWWTVDRWSLAALGMLIGFGVVMSLAASPPVAERIGYDGLHFVRRHLAMLPLALGLMLAVSLQPPRTIRRIAVIGFGISLVLLALTFVIGVEIKGARRWINFPGLSLQPSEFIKPTFAVVAAWLFAEQKLRPRCPGEGTVKDVLPDAHADFVFAVAGEEFGVVVCLVIVALFAFIVLRGFSRMSQEGSLFVLLAATGLLVQFGLQAAINMASSLHLIPTKGMTLPFLSYGGSSMLALGLGLGLILALSRRRLGGGEQ